MKKSATLLFAALLSVMMIIMTSCKKEDPEPDFPELIGTWDGTTSQNVPISFIVADIKGKLFVTMIDVTYSFAPGDTGTAMRYNSAGLDELDVKSFKVFFEDAATCTDYVDGTFVSDPLGLSGTFYVVNSDDPDHPLTGTYTAAKAK